MLGKHGFPHYTMGRQHIRSQTQKGDANINENEKWWKEPKGVWLGWYINKE